MQHLEGQVIWPADTASDGAGLTLTLTVQLRDVALQDIAAPLVAEHVAPVAAPAAGQYCSIATEPEVVRRVRNGQRQL